MSIVCRKICANRPTIVFAADIVNDKQLVSALQKLLLSLIKTTIKIPVFRAGVIKLMQWMGNFQPASEVVSGGAYNAAKIGASATGYHVEENMFTEEEIKANTLAIKNGNEVGAGDTFLGALIPLLQFGVAPQQALSIASKLALEACKTTDRAPSEEIISKILQSDLN